MGFRVYRIPRVRLKGSFGALLRAPLRVPRVPLKGSLEGSFKDSQGSFKGLLSVRVPLRV